MANATDSVAQYLRELWKTQHPIQASTHMYAGTFATRDSSGNVGAVTTGERLLGVVVDSVDNSTGSAQAQGKDVAVYRRFYLRLSVTGASAGDEGKAVFVGTSNDYSGSLNPRRGMFIGNIISFDRDGYAYILADNPGCEQWETWSDLADDGYLDLPDAAQGIVEVMANDEFVIAHIASDGTVTSIAASSDGAVADTDAKLCVFDNGTSARVRNRLGDEYRTQIIYKGVAV